MHIVDLIVGALIKLLKEQGYELIISAEAKAWLAREGYDPVFGARPLKRFIQHALETPLARRIIAGELNGDKIHVSYSEPEGLLIS